MLGNCGTTPHKLAGWQLVDRNGRVTDLDIEIGAGASALVPLDGTGVQLGNGGGNVVLKNDQGDQVRQRHLLGTGRRPVGPLHPIPPLAAFPGGRQCASGTIRDITVENSRWYPDPVMRTMRSSALASGPTSTRALFLRTPSRMIRAAFSGEVLASFLSKVFASSSLSRPSDGRHVARDVGLDAAGVHGRHLDRMAGRRPSPAAAPR